MEQIIENTIINAPDTFSADELWRIAALIGVFALVLGFVNFVLYPQGITYATHPYFYFPLFIFGMTLAYACAPKEITTVRISPWGAVATVLLVFAGLLSVWSSGAFTERAIKLIEILFQDFVIASVLSIIGKRLSNRNVRIGLAIAFAALHLPLFATASFQYSISVVLAALVVSYVATSWFAKTDQDISTVIVLHVAFYIIFGSVLSIILW